MIKRRRFSEPQLSVNIHMFILFFACLCKLPGGGNLSPIFTLKSIKNDFSLTLNLFSYQLPFISRQICLELVSFDDPLNV